MYTLWGIMWLKDHSHYADEVRDSLINAVDALARPPGRRHVLMMEVHVSDTVVTVEVFDMPAYTSCFSGG